MGFQCWAYVSVGICVIAFAVLGSESLFDSTIISNKGKGFQRFVSILEIFSKKFKRFKEDPVARNQKIIILTKVQGDDFPNQRWVGEIEENMFFTANKRNSSTTD